ncbi:hypothetical protein BKA64DRAFT_707299 [Cadophora sp. MPI-SDFR-AT-0126]|nr:hypothetical protein BKA64DRAFT_707299 [Leotiomycetes sp. MPI-SDFR-AT-0126]
MVSDILLNNLDSCDHNVPADTLNATKFQFQMASTSYKIMLAVLILGGLAIADVLDSPEFAGLFPNDELPSIPPDPEAWKSVKGVVVSRRSSDLAERQAGVVYLVLAITLVAQKVWSAVSWAVGLFGLGASAYGVAKDCVQKYNTADCIIASIGLMISPFATGYKVKSGFRVRSDGLETHAYWIDADEGKRTSEAHIPLSHRSLKVSSMATQNNGTWERHATFYWDNEEYRKATADDLGFENDGTFHHYRLEDSEHVKDIRKRIALGHPGLEKRLEARAYEVVTDYLWQNGNQEAYNQKHDSVDFKDMTRKIDNLLESNKLGVSCLTPIGAIASHGGSSRFRIDNGIVAYGWNDKPYGFNARARN